MASSKFIEILDNTTAQQHQISSSDVKLEDVLADQEATVQQQRSRSSSTQSSSSRKKPVFTGFVVTVVADFAGAEDEEVEKVYVERRLWAVICLSVSPLMGWVSSWMSYHEPDYMQA
ncbi:Hypothetical protein PENO1_063850 [Penicillium occitanis (nom. inval.)]|nr:Hypothetical protein PENO1_063850 [Penicillium occitanis (nom. inval.)]PCG97712.1 hypothetical protein PENOC_066590 [Penicillium occitanis (nom. inval.)]